MKRGQKTMTTALKKKLGNPGKRALPKNEPKPDGLVKLPPAPAYLSKIGKKEWRHRGAILLNLGLLTDLDIPGLASYCVVYSNFIEATLSLEKHGMLIKAQSGFPMQSPYLAIQNKSQAEMRRWLTEFGMTPSSRTGVTVTKKPKVGKFDGLRSVK